MKFNDEFFVQNNFKRDHHRNKEIHFIVSIALLQLHYYFASKYEFIDNEKYPKPKKKENEEIF